MPYGCTKRPYDAFSIMHWIVAIGSLAIYIYTPPSTVKEDGVYGTATNSRTDEVAVPIMTVFERTVK